MGMIQAARAQASDRGKSESHKTATAPPSPLAAGGALQAAGVNAAWHRLATLAPPPSMAAAGGEGVPPIQRLCSQCAEELDEGPDLQTKLDIGVPGDRFEREADAVSAQVLRMPWPGAEPRPIAPATLGPAPQVQPLCAACAGREDERLHLKASPGATPSPAPAAARAIAAPGPGAPVSAGVRARVEPVLGADLAGVRVHDDPAAREAADSIQARAFTHRNHIFLGAGERHDDLGLMAHELTHTVQQGGSPLARQVSGAVPSVQRLSWPSADDVIGTLEDAASGAGEALEGAGEALVDTAEAAGEAIGEAAESAGEAIGEAAESAGEAIGEAGEAIGEAAEAAGEAIGEAGEAVGEAASGAVDWLATEAGALAQSLADALGGLVSITPAGLLVTLPRFCPIPALTQSFDLENRDWEYPILIGGIPIGPVVIMGSVSLVGHLKPLVETQVGPFCLNGVRILINPLTGSYSIAGSVSATAAASLAAEVRGGLQGSLSLVGIIPIGGVPVPIEIPVLDLEGGVAGLVRGIGATTLTLGGGLSIGGGVIGLSQTTQLDLGLAGDLFLGAYAQLSLLGSNVCRIYWQPFDWHGDIGASLGIDLGLTIVPGSPTVGILTIGTPTLDRIPFDQIPLALSRDGFSDDCPVVDRICEVLRELGLLPSQEENGGSWSWSGPYGPGPRLDGPLDVWQKDPGIASGSECRGACGPNCDTCEPKGTYRYTDPATGDVWEYANFQDCNSNDGCREHDAAFDWAADVHGEIGGGAIVMPWHMAANIECACNNLAGNCIAWIGGLPPYDSKMYFADSATPVSGGGGTGPGGPEPGGTSCRDDYPNAPACPDTRNPDRETFLQGWGALHGIADFRDCTIAEDWRAGSLIGCAGAPGMIWQCTATDLATGQALTISVFECICCDPSDTSASDWMGPSIVVVEGMSEELLLELCDRDLIPRVICIPLEDEMIGRFGNRRRDIGLNPDTDPQATPRPDDAPIFESFRRMYNRLDSWNLYIRTQHPDWYAEFAGQCDATRSVEQLRTEWVDRLKERTKQFKEEFRNLKDTDVAAMQRRYEEQVLGEIQREIEACIRKIALWYLGKSGGSESPEELTERIHAEATELWRAAWRRAILQVNRVLSLLWPPAKTRILVWVGQQRARHPGIDLSGPVGELDYIGSLATGYKGPPKQQIRFNPDKFDVDANLPAPPLAKYAVAIDGLRPDRQRIFGRHTSIAPLNQFSDQAHAALSARVDGYDSSDRFDVVLEAPELPEQTHEREATERLYALRATLSPAAYNDLLAELQRGGFLNDSGSAVRGDLSDAEAEQVKEILDRHTPPAPTGGP